jgi:putative lipoic acid-binding regulatory protein
MALIEVIFDDDADIIQKQSTKGNFISITVKQVVMNVDEIIAIYEKAAEIEGVMSL